MRNRKGTKGFTLIELLIVIAIIGILAAVLIPNLMQSRRAAGTRAAQAYAQNVYTAINAYLAENVTATVADAIAPGCDPTVGYTLGGYSVNPISVNYVDTCTLAEVGGDAQVSADWGPGTTDAAGNTTLP